MENLKLNETPIRTAKNFKINNIKLENIEIPEVIPEFENVTIIGDTSKIDIEQNTINTEFSSSNLKSIFASTFSTNSVSSF